MNRFPNQKLSVGLLLTSFNIPAWQYKMLSQIKRADYAEIKLIVLSDDQGGRKRFLSNLRHNWPNLLYLIYCKWVARSSRLRPNAFETRNAIDLLAHIPVVKIRPRQTGDVDWIADEDVDTIERYTLDVLIQLGFKKLEGKILEASKFGVWSYQPVGNHHHGLAGFWEVFENKTIAGSILRLFSKNEKLVLYESYSATNPLSVDHTRNRIFWKGLSFLPRKLKELHDLGKEEFLTRACLENGQPGLDDNKYGRQPQNGDVIKLLAKYVMRYTRLKLSQQFFIEQWILLFDLQDEISFSFCKFKKIAPPKDRLWADPHVIYKDHFYYIFIEELLYENNKGHISVIKMDEAGNYCQPVKVLERAYHLSYPFVFEWQGAYYMIPETAVNRTIELYKCVRFPDRWEFCQTLMTDVVAVDTTLFYDGRKWWLFANIRENEGASKWDELFLFYADQPLSKAWRPHPQNPIVSDVRGARPAGRLFEYRGRIYRPAQNCSKKYGYQLNINRVAALNETDYQEDEAWTVAPDWDDNLEGVHTLAHAHKLTVIDGNVKRTRFSR